MTYINERVDLLFKQWDTPTSPGCVLAVIKDGEFIYKRSYGMADLERDVPITEGAIFDIGSIGKQFTATVIAILANQGLLTLDAPIREHLPEMASYADGIIIRQLVHHTSGLRDYLTLLDLSGLLLENTYAESFLFDLIVRQKGLNFEPGKEYLYSNSGYFLLGTIAERVTGKHITELIKEYILDPLGMNNTTFNKDCHSIVKNRALSYDKGQEEGTFVNALALSGGFGDGAILTCVDDLLLWDRNFYNNKLNNAQPDLIKKLHETGKLNNGKPINYAFGLDVTEYRGQRIVTHGGSWAGYVSEMMRFPDQHMTIICLTNLSSMDPTLLCQKVADIFLEDVLETEMPLHKRKLSTPKRQISMKQFAGLYQGKLQTYEVVTKDDGLFLSNGATEFPLLPVNGKFQIGQLSDYVTFTDENMILFKADSTTRFKRIQNERYYASSLKPYIGNYYSAELDIHYTIEEKNGTLQLRRTPFDEPKPVYILAENALGTAIGEIRLRLNDDGAIKGFDFNAGRVNHIKFRKVK